MYLDVKRIEFLVTLNCTGKCKHCQASEMLNTGERFSIDAVKACEAVTKLTKIFDVNYVLTFGGEPLLAWEIVCAIQQAAYDSGVEGRGVITNGYFSKDPAQIAKVAQHLAAAPIRGILLSVDAFHQETIPVEPVRLFAEELLKAGMQNLRLHPAWVVDASHPNPYNRRTKELLGKFADLDIEVSDGNNIFLMGNAAKYLAEYYDEPTLDLSLGCGRMPYTEPLDAMTSISILPNGDVKVCWFTIGNIYREDIDTIVTRYNPYEHQLMRIVLREGVAGLVGYAKTMGIEIDLGKYYTDCGVCQAVGEKIVQRLAS